MNETGERLYQEREKRVSDAIALRKPDRLPIIVRFHFFPGTYAGMTAEELMYDPEKTAESYWKVIRDFEPDMIQNPFGRFLGPCSTSLTAGRPDGRVEISLPTFRTSLSNRNI